MAETRALTIEEAKGYCMHPYHMYHELTKGSVKWMYKYISPFDNVKEWRRCGSAFIDMGYDIKGLPYRVGVVFRWHRFDDITGPNYVWSCDWSFLNEIIHRCENHPDYSELVKTCRMMKDMVESKMRFDIVQGRCRYMVSALDPCDLFDLLDSFEFHFIEKYGWNWLYNTQEIAGDSTFSSAQDSYRHYMFELEWVMRDWNGVKPYEGTALVWEY